MYEIETREVPEQQVASIQRSLLADELPQFIGESMGAIYRHLGNQDAATGIPFVVYHGVVSNDSDGPVEVCVPYRGLAEAAEGIRLRPESAHREAYTRIEKKQVVFPEILEAYSALDEWVETNGCTLAGSPREVYFADWDAIGDSDPACDVAFPIES